MRDEIGLKIEQWGAGFKHSDQKSIRSFLLYRAYIILFNSLNVGNFFLEFNLKDYRSSRKEKEIRCLVFTSSIDCKTVRIFAYSSTGEQSNKRSGTRLKTECETGERR